MIIGINGKIGSGKDTIGRIIQYLVSINNAKVFVGNRNNDTDFKSYNESWVDTSEWKIKKFADKLKDIVCLLINCTREQLENREFKEKELGEEWESTKLRNPYNNKTIIISQITHEEIDLMLGTKYLGYISDGNIKLTPRLLLQLIGTECGRNIIHPNIWVNSVFSNYGAKETSFEKSNDFVLIGKEKVPVKFPNWIITDLRFPNELKAIKKRGGISIRVNRSMNAINGKCIDKCKDYPNCKPCGNIKPQHESETALDNATFDYTINNNGTIEDLIIKVKEILIKEKII